MKKTPEPLPETEKQSLILEEKIKALQMMGGAVAHELRTPLASIGMAAKAVEKFLPELFQGYRLAVSHKLLEPTVSEARFTLIENVVENIQKEVVACNNFINALLLNIHNLAVDLQEMPLLSIKTCLEKLIEHYPFKEKEREFTHVHVEYDFNFKGIEVLMQHVLLNLLKNAIYYVLESGKGNASIEIWTELRKEKNILHFKDTGCGVSQERLPHIFERFFTNRHNGTGVGLAFCKRVMTQFGGSIECDSQEGEYTHFILHFPVVDEKKHSIQA